MSVRVAPGVVLLHENQTQLTDWVVVAHLYPLSCCWNISFRFCLRISGVGSYYLFQFRIVFYKYFDFISKFILEKRLVTTADTRRRWRELKRRKFNQQENKKDRHTRRGMCFSLVKKRGRKNQFFYFCCLI
jgi:hypothetical protein